MNGLPQIMRGVWLVGHGGFEMLEVGERLIWHGARGRIGRGLVWGAAASGLLVAAWVLYEEGVAYPRAMQRRDFAAAHASLDRLEWFGRGNFVLRMQTPRPGQRPKPPGD